MKCSTHKVCYETREMAVEALIQNRSRYHHASNSGPLNVYQCDSCGLFHFTSKGPAHEALTSEENKKRIELGREASYWEDKYRRK